jgi:hypothetical protein
LVILVHLLDLDEGDGDEDEKPKYLRTFSRANLLVEWMRRTAHVSLGGALFDFLSRAVGKIMRLFLSVAKNVTDARYETSTPP